MFFILDSIAGISQSPIECGFFRDWQAEVQDNRAKDNTKA